MKLRKISVEDFLVIILVGIMNLNKDLTDTEKCSTKY